MEANGKDKSNADVLSVEPPKGPTVISSLTSREFWSSLGTLSFWEDGCLGKSLITGTVVAALASVHRYRNVKNLPPSKVHMAFRIADWGLMGFMLGAGVNYYPCRMRRDELRKERAEQQSKQLVKMFKNGEI